MKYYDENELSDILKEASELIAIFTATVKKLKANPKG